MSVTFLPLLIGPPGYVARAFCIVQQALFFEHFCKTMGVVEVAFPPMCKEIGMGEKVALAVVAGGMREDEIVAEVYRVA